MQRYKMVLAYDGTAYYGWQAQSSLPTIESTLSQTFRRIFNADIRMLGASRTDAGVHALGQVARFDTSIVVDAADMLHAWNNRLPDDIVIHSIEPVSNTYHPHHNVDRKTYYYHFFTERPLPLYQRYGIYYRQPLSIERVQEALRMFIGTHDFRSFTVAKDARQDTIRTIYDIQLSYIDEYGCYRIVITGNKFMRHMIRRLVGAALYVGAHPEFSLLQLHVIFKANDARHYLPNAAAKGLLLRSIQYKK